MINKLYLCTYALLFFISTHLEALQPFIVVTPEKTGTHLLTKTLERLVKKKTHNYWCHKMTPEELVNALKWAEENDAFVHMHALPDQAMIDTLLSHSYKVIFLMRDPRDTMVSLFHYIEIGWAYARLNLKGQYGNLSKDKKFDEIITGKRYGTSAVRSIILRRLDWMKQDPEFVCTVYFENLIGKEGGGSAQKQKNTIRELAKHIDVKLNATLMKEVTTDLFGAPTGTPSNNTTFRKGQIGSWKEEFSRANVFVFKHYFGKDLISLGYERDLAW